jgi:hypothetical protein
METLRIELRNKNALSILKSLEKAKIIKLLDNDHSIIDSPIYLKGSISKRRAIELVREIEKSREEWDERTT